MENLLQDRVAVITGGASGLGRETAHLFAKEGAKIAILDFNTEAAETVRGEIEDATDSAVLVAEVDVSSIESVENAFQQVAAEFGGTDVLVNSAGIREVAAPLDIAIAEWEKVLNVNLSGTFFCSRVAAQQMIPRGGGSIVNLSSIVGLVGTDKRPAYAASKAGVIGLARSLTKDLGPQGIRANAICPGIMRTPLTESFFADEEWAAGLPNFVPAGRPGYAEDIAKAALFLASDLSAYISGIALPVDGGFTATGTFGSSTTLNTARSVTGDDE